MKKILTLHNKNPFLIQTVLMLLFMYKSNSLSNNLLVKIPSLTTNSPRTLLFREFLVIKKNNKIQFKTKRSRMCNAIKQIRKASEVK